MGVTFYMLSHLLSISPVCLNHTMFLPPSSVTVVSTEEVEQGYGMFRTQMLGDTSHLYCAGEPVSHGIFCGDSAGASVMIAPRARQVHNRHVSLRAHRLRNRRVSL